MFAAGNELDANVLVVRHRGELIRREAPRNIDVALLEQEALRRGFWDMSHDHALHMGRPEVVIGIGLKRDGFVRLPGDEVVRAGPSRMRLEPGIAEIAIHLIRERYLLFHDRRGEGAHQIQHQRGSEVLGDFEGQRAGIGRLHQVPDVVLTPAELVK